MRGRRALAAALAAAAALTASFGASNALARVAYLSTENLNGVSPIDLATGKEIGSRITVGTEPQGVAISPDGSRAYVANLSSSTVSVIDTGTNAVVGKAIPIGSKAKPVTVVVSPDGRNVYVRCVGVSKLFVIDTTTGGIVQEIPVEARGIALSPDGKSLYVGELPGRVSVYDTSTGKPTGQVLDSEADPGELEVSPDGGTLYALHFGSAGTVTKVDIASGAHTPIPVGEAPVSMALTPNGRRLFIGRETPIHGHLTVVETATDSTVGGPIEIGGGPAAMAVAPAGDFAYTGVGSAADGAIQSIDTSTLTIGTAANSYGAHEGLAIVPNQGPIGRLDVAISGNTATFSAAASTDPDGQVASYSWDFGDGTTASAPAASVSHTYAPGATYTARVTPLDNEGCRGDPRLHRPGDALQPLGDADRDGRGHPARGAEIAAARTGAGGRRGQARPRQGPPRPPHARPEQGHRDPLGQRLCRRQAEARRPGRSAHPASQAGRQVAAAGSFPAAG